MVKKSRINTITLNTKTLFITVKKIIPFRIEMLHKIKMGENVELFKKEQRIITIEW